MRKFTIVPATALLAILLCGYVFLSWHLIVSRGRHYVFVLLAYQYLTFLPALIYYLHSARRPAAPAWHSPALRPILFAFCCMVVIAAILTNIYVGEALAVSDESAYRFQARVFASGKAWADPLPGPGISGPPPAPVHFEHHVTLNSRWFGKYPPGWPVMLAVAIRYHGMALINPVLGIVLGALLFLIGRTMFDQRTASLAVLFLILSPLFFENVAGTMSHAWCGVWIVAGCYLCLLGLVRGSNALFWAGFGCIAVSCLVRPLTGAAAGLAIGLGVLYAAHRWRQRVAPILVAAVVPAVAAALCFLAVQYYYTGNPFLSPYALAAGRASVGEIDIHPSHLLLNALNLHRRELMSTRLFTMPFWTILAIYGIWRESRGRAALLTMLLPFPVTVALYLAQPENAAGVTGGRYYFEAFCLACVVAARGMVLLLERMRIARAAVWLLLAMFGVLQLSQDAVVLRMILNNSYPSREVWRHARGEERVVFLHGVEDNGPFIPKFYNWNQPDWRHARYVFLVDPGPREREQWAARFSESRWRVVGFYGNELRVARESAVRVASGP